MVTQLEKFRQYVGVGAGVFFMLLTLSVASMNLVKPLLIGWLPGLSATPGLGSILQIGMIFALIMSVVQLAVSVGIADTEKLKSKVTLTVFLLIAFLILSTGISKGWFGLGNLQAFIPPMFMVG